MRRFSGGPGMPNHIIVITPQGGAFTVRCIPHGAMGLWQSHLLAMLCACGHDDEYGKDWL